MLQNYLYFHFKLVLDKYFIFYISFWIILEEYAFMLLKEHKTSGGLPLYLKMLTVENVL